MNDNCEVVFCVWQFAKGQIRIYVVQSVRMVQVQLHAFGNLLKVNLNNLWEILYSVSLEFAFVSKCE